MDPQYYANVETNLFPLIQKQFSKTGFLEAVDLLAILAWKANRATNKHISRVGGVENFNRYAPALGAELYEAKSNENRLRIAMTGAFKFRLPTASALLTVLYPDSFTVYDVRVCDQLEKFHKLANRRFSSALFSEYEEYKAAVMNAVPYQCSLREADHYLWGKSWLMDAYKRLGTQN